MSETGQARRMMRRPDAPDEQAPRQPVSFDQRPVDNGEEYEFSFRSALHDIKTTLWGDFKRETAIVVTALAVASGAILLATNGDDDSDAQAEPATTTTAARSSQTTAQSPNTFIQEVIVVPAGNASANNSTGEIATVTSLTTPTTLVSPPVPAEAPAATPESQDTVTSTTVAPPPPAAALPPPSHTIEAIYRGGQTMALTGDMVTDSPDDLVFYNGQYTGLATTRTNPANTRLVCDDDVSFKLVTLENGKTQIVKDPVNNLRTDGGPRCRNGAIPGDFSQPSLRISPDGSLNGVFVHTKPGNSPTADIWYAKSVDGGAGWVEPHKIATIEGLGIDDYATANPELTPSGGDCYLTFNAKDTTGTSPDGKAPHVYVSRGNSCDHPDNFQDLGPLLLNVDGQTIASPQIADISDIEVGGKRYLLFYEAPAPDPAATQRILRVGEFSLNTGAGVGRVSMGQVAVPVPADRLDLNTRPATPHFFDSADGLDVSVTVRYGSDNKLLYDL